MRGRPRPRLAGGEPGPSWRAFPFSMAENLFSGAMGMTSGQEEEGEWQEGMDWKGSRRSVHIAGGGQPLASTITGNHDPFLHAGTCQVMRSPRRHGESGTPTSNQSPRGAQGRRLLGPAALRTCPFASLLSQVQARLGPGAYCRHSGNGGTQTCLPAACSAAQGVAQYGPSSSTQAQDPHEGPSLAGGR